MNAALANKTILDFQDGMQYYAALHAGCQAIITENKSDFHFAEIPVFDSAYYLREIAIPLIHKKA